MCTKDENYSSCLCGAYGQTNKAEVKEILTAWGSAGDITKISEANEEGYPLTRQ